MTKELELWQFIASRVDNSEPVLLLVVAESSGSSPGRAGYKMAVAADGGLCGSIGGGVMEVRLVEQARSILQDPRPTFVSRTIEQVHQKNSPDSSGMICSGKQTVIVWLLTPRDSDAVSAIIDVVRDRTPALLKITPTQISVNTDETESAENDFRFERNDDSDFVYREWIGPSNSLLIIGGGHCALALSELMSKMDFHISIFDDRAELNTLDKNRFADRIEIIESYDRIADHIPASPNAYVVVMTLGYAFDKIVIQKLLDRDFRYFGVLGSKAKMATLMKELRAEGYDEAKLRRIHTPIGLPINSNTPEEIAVSIAAEIISVKNSVDG